jgi:hypothetical protein
VRDPLLGALLPKRRFDPQLEERRDEAAKVVTQDLGKNLVHLRDGRLRANAAPKLGLIMEKVVSTFDRL